MGGDVYLTMSEVTSRLGISEARVRQLIDNGHLRAYRSGNRSLYRAEDVACLARSLQTTEPEPESSETSVSLLESLDTTASGEVAPRIGGMSFFTEQWIRKLTMHRPGRNISTTVLGWIVLIWGVVGFILGIHRIQQASIVTEGKELALGVAILYICVKFFLALIGLLMLLRSRRAFILGLATMFLAILESALYATMVKPIATGDAVITIVLVTVAYLSVVLYLANGKILRECGHG